MSIIIFFFFLILSIFEIHISMLLSADSTKCPLASIMDQNTTRNNNYSNCFLFDMNNWVYFDLNKITSKQEMSIVIDSNTTLYYNFCGNTLTKCKGEDSMVVLNRTNGDCENLSYSKENLKQWRYTLDETKTLTLKMDSPLPCDDKYNFSTIFNFLCDENMQEDEFQLDEARNKLYRSDFINVGKTNMSNNFNACDKRIFFISKAACPQNNIYPLWRFYLEYEYIFGMIFILTGFFLILFGFHNPKTTNFLLAIYFIYFTSHYGFLFLNFSYEEYVYVLWVSIALQIILGFILFHFMLRYSKLKVFIFSCLSGMCGSNFIYYSALSKMTYALTTFFSNLVIGIAVFTIIYECFLKVCTGMVITTCLSGAFLIIKV